MNALIPLLGAIVLHAPSIAAAGDGAPGARWLVQSMSGCNPRVRLCEREAESADERADVRERRSRHRGTLACNPRVRICDAG